MAGLWHLSHHQLHDLNGKPYPGALAQFYAADSLDPITVFQDYGLNVPFLSNPVEANGFGVFPPIFLAEDDNFFRQRITDQYGDIIPGTDVGVLPIVGPAGSGGGTVTTVDPTAIYQTGDVKIRMGTGVHSGFVRVNGRTVGSATSGATERANADTQFIFEHVWNNFSDAICPVSSGRGLTANADWLANKRIALPDAAGCALGFLDDMGAGAKARLTAATFAAANNGPSDLGAIGGVEKIGITKPQLPVLGLVANVTDPGHFHPNVATDLFGYGGGAGTAAKQQGANGALANTGLTVAIPEIGAGAEHNNVQKTVLFMAYAKL